MSGEPQMRIVRCERPDTYRDTDGVYRCRCCDWSSPSFAQRYPDAPETKP